MNNPILLFLAYNVLTFAAVFLAVYYGRTPAKHWVERRELSYDRVLRHQLLLDIEPRTALVLELAGVAILFFFGFFALNSVIAGLICAGLGMLVPQALIRYLEAKRREKLESQLVDGLTTIASGVRAGLNLVQSFELLQRNAVGPIKQEFGQILREYQMGVDLNQALRNASNRIGSSLYRLTFTAIEMHRTRGGDTGESMDRIAESVREIRRLEGKLDALTAQGRAQATMMAVMPLVFIGMLYIIEPEGVRMLFFTAKGRLVLLLVIALIAGGFFWIRKILSVDI